MLGVAMEAGIGKELSNLALRLPLRRKYESLRRDIVQPRQFSDTCHFVTEEKLRRLSRAQKEVAVGARLPVR